MVALHRRMNYLYDHYTGWDVRDAAACSRTFSLWVAIQHGDLKLSSPRFSYLLWGDSRSLFLILPSSH